AEGMARLYEAGDAVTAAVHGPSIAAALAALAVKHAPELIARARSALLDPPAGFGPLPVVIRVGLERNAFEAPPDAAPGLAPALPIMIPPAVRRALSGQRRVAVATQQAGHLRIGPALWSDDFRLALPTWRQLAAGEPAAVIAQSAHSEDGAAADWATTAALALEGPIGERGELRPARGTWWLGSRHGDIDLSAASDDGVTIPD
ncbi:MAG TPA: hypothetical protein VML96_01230, partial [Egibacteraceae bacterium]|nr:hypothetical protein [Egibacteraceae bacterium]